MSKDFRYTMPDGSVVEGFQMTEDMRYQEKKWPEWMNSRYLVTYDHGEHRLNINDVETKIPHFGWVIKKPDGTITAVEYTAMEQADKVVKEEAVVHPEAPVNEEGLLELGAKLTGKSVEELRAEQEAKRPKEGHQTITSAGSVEPNRIEPEEYGIVVDVDGSLVREMRLAYELLKADDVAGAMKEMAKSLGDRANWCNCGPGSCSGNTERWNCRKNSPLVQS